jgi:hypothetical protein
MKKKQTKTKKSDIFTGIDLKVYRENDMIITYCEKLGICSDGFTLKESVRNFLILLDEEWFGYKNFSGDESDPISVCKNLME